MAMSSKPGAHWVVEVQVKTFWAGVAILAIDTKQVGSLQPCSLAPQPVLQMQNTGLAPTKAQTSNNTFSPSPGSRKGPLAVSQYRLGTMAPSCLRAYLSFPSASCLQPALFPSAHYSLLSPLGFQLLLGYSLIP